MKATVWTILALGLLASASMAEDMVDNPQYKQWSAHKVGTLIKVQMTTVTSAGETEMTSKVTMTTTLKELTADKAVIEIVTEMDVNGQKMTMPAQKQEIPAKVAKSTTQPTSAPGVTTTKKGEGDEEITVAGAKYKAHWVEYQMTGETMEATSKTWTTDKVPGGLLKSKTETTKPMKSKTSMELVEFKPGT